MSQNPARLTSSQRCREQDILLKTEIKKLTFLPVILLPYIQLLSKLLHKQPPENDPVLSQP
jgi:hypothetical protein